jgi:hypothetical protein
MECWMVFKTLGFQLFRHASPLEFVVDLLALLIMNHYNKKKNKQMERKTCCSSE